VWWRGFSSPVRQSHTARDVAGLFASRNRDSVYTGNVNRASVYCSHFLALRWLPRRMDHEPQRACDEIPCRRLAYHAAPRDHVVGTLSTLVSTVFSYVASGADVTWRLALSSPGEPTQSNEFSVVRWQPWPFHTKPSR
jgi:hypothetical protein